MLNSDFPSTKTGRIQRKSQPNVGWCFGHPLKIQPGRPREDGEWNFSEQ